jgi:hypothetical protein
MNQRLTMTRQLNQDHCQWPRAGHDATRSFVITTRALFSGPIAAGQSSITPSRKKVGRPSNDLEWSGHGRVLFGLATLLARGAGHLHRWSLRTVRCCIALVLLSTWDWSDTDGLFFWTVVFWAGVLMVAATKQAIDDQRLALGVHVLYTDRTTCITKDFHLGIKC